MKKGNKKKLYIAIFMFAAFLLWTVAVKFIDVKAIGPEGSEVGFATLNSFVHELFGVHMDIYLLTDALGLIPILTMLAFAIFGFCQLIRRKKLHKVDYDILVLGGFYAVVFAVYILFEAVAVNYRPVLIEGVLEASYPSSTTMLVMCVMPTAFMQLNSLLKSSAAKRWLSFTIIIFTAFMVIARLISGVHWFSDIVGGAFISSALVMMYSYVCSLKAN